MSNPYQDRVAFAGYRWYVNDCQRKINLNQHQEIIDPVTGEKFVHHFERVAVITLTLALPLEELGDQRADPQFGKPESISETRDPTLRPRRKIVFE